MKNNLPLLFALVLVAFASSCSSEDEPIVYSEMESGHGVGWGFFNGSDCPWEDIFAGLTPPESNHPDYQIVNSPDEYDNLPAGYLPKGYGSLIEEYPHMIDDHTLIIARSQFATTNVNALYVNYKIYDGGKNNYLIQFDIHHGQAVTNPEVLDNRYTMIFLFYIKKIPANSNILIEEIFN